MNGAANETKPVNLLWLLDGIASLDAAQAVDRSGGAVQVTDLTLDSRDVRPGSLFFALAGQRRPGGQPQRHGLEYALEAATRGARVVLWEPSPGVTPPSLPTSVFVASIPELPRLLGRIADRFFRWPSQYLRISGFTGTNGKTTCAYLLAQCLERLGTPSAYLGTIGFGRIPQLAPSTHTTPDVIRMHRTLAQFRAQGLRDVALEVSSHALAQGRVDAVRFHLAAFTNLTRDHLDYHESMEAYGEAKARLFAFPELQSIVINVGDEFGRRLAERCASSGVSSAAAVTGVWVGAGGFGWLAPQSLRVAGLHADRHGLNLELDGSFGAFGMHSSLIGRFNAENLVVVLACLIGLGVPRADAAAALAACTAAPGRMQLISAGDAKPLAVVDYAHTPDALAKALRALREHCKGLLWCVFGCGGDRDPGKRALMGAADDELADRIIVTDDNPRNEDPEKITAAILEGIESVDARVIHDRGAAIATAIAEARADDIVLIAGKGHEDYQICGDQRREFSDQREAERLLGVAA